LFDLARVTARSSAAAARPSSSTALASSSAIFVLSPRLGGLEGVDLVALTLRLGDQGAGLGLQILDLLLLPVELGAGASGQEKDG